MSRKLYLDVAFGITSGQIAGNFGNDPAWCMYEIPNSDRTSSMDVSRPLEPHLLGPAR